VIPAAYIARENVAVTDAAIDTPVAAGAGDWVVTVGAAGFEAAVVNDHVTGAARATPSTALTAVERVTVYDVESASGAVGVSVAVREPSVYATVAGTATPAFVFKEKDEVVTEVGSSEREKTASGSTAGLSPVAPLLGNELVTVGGTGAWVVNVQEKAAANAVPSSAFAAVEIFAV
jgi:hypothetical protein